MIAGQVDLTRYRYPTPVDEDDGSTSVGEPVVLPFTGTFQPARGEDLKILLEGDRQGAYFKIHTYTDLRGVDQYGEELADEVDFELKRYRVVATEPQPAVIAHTKAIVARKDEGTT